MLVRDRMTTPVITVDPEENIRYARELMQRHSIRRLPVVLKGALLGMISDRDIRGASLPEGVPRYLLERYNLLRVVRVREVMSAPVITVSPDMPVEEAAETMRERGVGGLPVVDRDGRLAGMITQLDILQGILESLGVREGSFRVDVGAAVHGKPWTLAAMCGAIERAGGQVLTALTLRAEEEERRAYSFRVQAEDPAELVEQLDLLEAKVLYPRAHHLG